MEAAVFEPRECFEAVRGVRGFEAKADGLWRTGRLDGLGRPCVAIVGTRAATGYGRRLARQFARRLGSSGCTIVSGLALGIDSEAHLGALDAGAPTVAVLGSGHERLFPARNRPLAQSIVDAGGAVLSPYPPEQIAQPYQFLARNGIVAALADAVLVVEAPARSGALNTATWAAGRVPVLAVPSDVDRRHSQGCLALIRDGAILARSADDVLESLGQPAFPLPREGVAAVLPDDPLARSLLDALNSGISELDDLIAATGAQPQAALAALTALELGGWYARPL
jgi:DNA processing protein